METQVISMRLVKHNVDNEYVQHNCSVEWLKGAIDFYDEEILNHRFTNDIANSDIAISLKDINNYEEYGYVFINKKIAPDGNIVYLFQKIILDERLEPMAIASFICWVLTTMMGDNMTRVDRIIISNKNYPFYIPAFYRTYLDVTKEILRLFLTDKKEIESDVAFMSKLKEYCEICFRESMEFSNHVSHRDNFACTKDIIPSIEVWTLTKPRGIEGETRHTITELVYNCMKDMCETFIYTHRSVTFAIPSASPLTQCLLNEFRRNGDNTLVVDNLLVKMSVQEVDDYIYMTDSPFRRKYADKYSHAHELFEMYCSKMTDGIFRLHLIEDTEMREVIELTIKAADKFYGTYMSALNGRDVLIVDDNITTEQELLESYKYIADCYEPQSITILTVTNHS